jgi:hypothetical protein
MNPTANTVDVSLDTELSIPGGIAVTLEPITLELYRAETKPDIIPYTKVALPSYHVEGDTQVSVQSQTTKITNMKQFILFLHRAVYGKTFTMSAYGATMAHIGALNLPIHLDKDIELNGKLHRVVNRRKS